MKTRFSLHTLRGQSAVEYLLLLGVVVAIVLVGFQKYVPKTYNAANTYFNAVSNNIMGAPNRCGNGSCDRGESKINCCVDCGGC